VRMNLRSLTETADAAGTVSFATLTFTQSGTYVYTITETQNDDSKYSADDAVYTLVYEVNDQDGSLAVDTEIQKDGESTDDIVFVNAEK